MALSQPVSGDKLNFISHSLLHRVVAVDVDAPVKSLNVDSSGNIGAGTETPTSKLHVAGSLALPYLAITSVRTLDETDYTVDCTANTFTVTLPTAVDIQGRIYNIKNTGTGVITVATTSSQTIDGETTQTIRQWENLTVQSNNTNWIIL